MSRALRTWQDANVPAGVLLLVAFLVFVMPGGIPLTALLAVVWLPKLRREHGASARVRAPAGPAPGAAAVAVGGSNAPDRAAALILRLSVPTHETG